LDSMEQLSKTFANTKQGLKTLPLTVTRRCPKTHVELAQQLVPEIEAMDNAPDGDVVITDELFTELSKPSDLILCRTNAPLVACCYAHIRKGVKATIRGRDMGQGLTNFMRKLKAVDVVDLHAKLDEYWAKEEPKLKALGRKGQNRLVALDDKIQCMIEISQETTSLMDVENRIKNIFSDFEPDGSPKNAVVHATVHKAKGLEARNVFILNPDQMPFPMAKQPHEIQQEFNIIYVAVTRGKYEPKDPNYPGRLIFAKGLPSVFASRRENTVELSSASKLPV
jgi:DNA helicase II / ATP-dependent DNA helicase PcrA